MISNLESKANELFQNVKRSAIILAAAGSIAACASDSNPVQTGKDNSYTIQDVPVIVTYREGEIKFENVFPGNYSAFDNLGINIDTSSFNPDQKQYIDSFVDHALNRLYEKVGEEGLTGVKTINIQHAGENIVYDLLGDDDVLMKIVSIPSSGLSAGSDTGSNAPLNLRGSIYSEGGVWAGEETEYPAMFNFSLGYNANEGNIEKGLVLLPNLRFSLRRNATDTPWGNYVEGGIGAAYAEGPFLVGIEFANRWLIASGEGPDGIFGRLYAQYWTRHDFDPLNDSDTFPMQPYIVQYGEFVADTLLKNPELNYRIEGGLKMVELEGLRLGPFVAGKFNFDVDNEPWNRYIEGTAGVNIGFNPVQVQLGVGRRLSLNDAGSSFSFGSALPSLWIGLDFSPEYKPQ